MPGHVPDSEGRHDLRAGDPYYYYHREERLALPNRPQERKRYKSSRYIIYVIDVILLFMAYQCVIRPRIGKPEAAAAVATQSSATVLRGEYRFQLKLDREQESLELRLIVNRRDGASFALPAGYKAQFFRRSAAGETHLAAGFLPDEAPVQQPFAVLAVTVSQEALPEGEVPGVRCPVPGSREELELLLEQDGGE